MKELFVGEEREYEVVEVVKDIDLRPFDRRLKLAVMGEEEGEVNGRSYEQDDCRRCPFAGPAGEDSGRPFTSFPDASPNSSCRTPLAVALPFAFAYPLACPFAWPCPYPFKD